MDLSSFEKRIGVSFKDKSLLMQAFTHRSYLNEHREKKLGHNERLEFLGDAVLELSVTRFLYDKFPEATEGDLTAYRSALVNTMSLAHAATLLGMNDYLLLSRGEARDTGRARQFILANTYESVVGSIYMDQGYDAADAFIGMSLLTKIDGIIEEKSFVDSKSKFQEVAQEKVSITPSYRTIEEIGPDHDKSFEVGAFLKDELVASGRGRSKQEAEQVAARNALKVKDWL